MTNVFDFLLAEKIIPSTAAPAFERYLADRAFQAVVECRMLAQDRVSLVTLAGSVPVGMSQGAMFNLLYKMRHRFRSALEQLRALDLKTSSTSDLYNPRAREPV